ncbi:hypothetical protein HDU91_004617 [Kappamyces sp. JEL0680]|nr:hypothetical protein HDU91_004617 [Kappamyces sp. JEL0680]
MPWSLPEVQQFYDSYASKYDEDIKDASLYPSPHTLSAWIDEHLELHHVQGVTEMLDVGVGTGKSSALFFEKDTQYTSLVTGVDASAKAGQLH